MTPTEKHVNHESKSLTVKDQPIARKIEILLLGFLDNPKVPSGFLGYQIPTCGFLVNPNLSSGFVDRCANICKRFAISVALGEVDFLGVHFHNLPAGRYVTIGKCPFLRF